jgi:short-subunit dehydrogenase
LLPAPQKESTKAFASQGAKVAIIARSEDKLDAAAKSLAVEVKDFSADLTQATDVRRVIAEVVAYYREIDILVNNVGGGTFKPLQQQTAAEADLPIGIPLTAAIAASHAVAPSMVARGSGHIVSLTSPAGYVPFPYIMSYVATRHAMAGLALSLHEELKEHGVGSTLFSPAKLIPDTLSVTTRMWTGTSAPPLYSHSCSQRYRQ